MRVSKEIGVDYGHTLPNHFSMCNQIHGHRARVIATVEGDVNVVQGDSSQGMVLDFKHLKAAMMERIHAKLDHGFAVWELGGADLEYMKNRNTNILVTPEPPTAEYLAQWAFEQLEEALQNKGFRVIEVMWYETPSSYASYSKRGIIPTTIIEGASSHTCPSGSIESYRI